VGFRLSQAIGAVAEVAECPKPVGLAESSLAAVLDSRAASAATASVAAVYDDVVCSTVVPAARPRPWSKGTAAMEDECSCGRGAIGYREAPPRLDS